MMEPMPALTARIVRSSTCERRSSILGIRAAISTMSFSVPSLNTRSSRRPVEARSSESMRPNACAISPISSTCPSPGTTADRLDGVEELAEEDEAEERDDEREEHAELRLRLLQALEAPHEEDEEQQRQDRGEREDRDGCLPQSHRSALTHRYRKSPFVTIVTWIVWARPRAIAKRKFRVRKRRPVIAPPAAGSASP